MKHNTASHPSFIVRSTLPAARYAVTRFLTNQLTHSRFASLNYSHKSKGCVAIASATWLRVYDFP